MLELRIVPDGGSAKKIVDVLIERILPKIREGGGDMPFLGG